MTQTLCLAGNVRDVDGAIAELCFCNSSICSFFYYKAFACQPADQAVIDGAGK